MRALCLLIITCTCGTAWPDTLNVAVASNFRPVLEKLAERFEQSSGHRLRISSAASGVLMQQIRYGADYQIFLSADKLRPQALYREGLASEPATYAIGQLALIARENSALPGDLNRESLAALLGSATERSVAIANPDTAPYGDAARALYQSLQLWQRTARSLVEAGNIAQAYLLVERGHAQLALTASALLKQGSLPGVTLPTDWYPAIHQQAALLQSASQHAAASQAFMQFLLSSDSQAFISQHGYLAATDAENP